MSTAVTTLKLTPYQREVLASCLIRAYREAQYEVWADERASAEGAKGHFKQEVAAMAQVLKMLGLDPANSETGGSTLERV